MDKSFIIGLLRIVSNAVIANLPLRYHRCPECLVVSTNGHGHVSPCSPSRTISPLRRTMYSEKLANVLDLRFQKDSVVQFLDTDQLKFVRVNAPMTLLNDVIEGMFSLQETTSHTMLCYKAVSIKRSSIVVGFWKNGAWRLRLRLVVSTKNGLMAFPLTKTLYLDNGKILIPTKYKANTALFIGLHSEEEVNRIGLRIWANDFGHVNEPGNFNGYTAHIDWSKNEDELTIPNQLKYNHATMKMFKRNLYRANGVHRIIRNVFERISAPAVPVPSHDNRSDNIHNASSTYENNLQAMTAHSNVEGNQGASIVPSTRVDRNCQFENTIPFVYTRWRCGAKAPKAPPPPTKSPYLPSSTATKPYTYQVP